MKILFVTGYAYLPQLYGGMQTTTNHLCYQLLKKGHKASVLSGFNDKGAISLACKVQKKLLRRKVSQDTTQGYPVWRTWCPWEEMEYVIRQEKPDVIVCMSSEIARTAEMARQHNIPFVIQVHDVFFDSHGGDIKNFRNAPWIASSHSTAEKYRSTYGVNPMVIYPFINARNYKTWSMRRNVTFINPCEGKGLDIALNIARMCPDIPFAFVETQFVPQHRRKVMRRIADLPNVTLHSRQKNMRKVYGNCRILLAPSLYEEAYGMVVTEAQTSGIPAVTSTRGGLPEAVGPGGILVNPDDSITNWVSNVRKLWENNRFYAELSGKALEHAHRPEIKPSYQTEQWEKILSAQLSP